MVDTIPAPFRTQFDEARDPLTARNRLGAVGTSEMNTAIAAAIAGAGGSYATQADFPAGAWTNWTPTFTAGGGTITSTSITRARYIQLGNTVIATLDVTITNAGSGAGSLIVTLPIAPIASFLPSYGREAALTGNSLNGFTSSGVWQILNYNNSTPIATNARILSQIIYEVA